MAFPRPSLDLLELEVALPDPPSVPLLVTQALSAGN
jgi:hypothetical protein